MSYNVTISGTDYEGIDKVELPITSENTKATFYADNVIDFLRGNVLEVFETDDDLRAKGTSMGSFFNKGYAFYGQSMLKKVSLPNVINIPAYCFDSCESLVDVNIPSATTIGSRNAFSLCTSLEEIALPLLKTLTMANFNGCTKLKKVDLPVCTTINGGNNFNNCSSLEALILRSTTMCTLTKTNDFLGSGVANGTGYIYVPSSLVDTYKSATNWSTYSAQFRAIEDYPDICGR